MANADLSDDGVEVLADRLSGATYIRPDNDHYRLLHETCRGLLEDCAFAMGICIRNLRKGAKERLRIDDLRASILKAVAAATAAAPESGVVDGVVRLGDLND